MNWDKVDSYDKESQLPLVQMTGLSKLSQQPIYDWDFIAKYKESALLETNPDLIDREDMPSAEHFFISFDEFNESKITCSFNGTIEENITLPFSDDDIFTLYKVNDFKSKKFKLYTDQPLTGLDELKEINQEIEKMGSMYTDFAIIYRYGKAYVGMYNRRTKSLNAYTIYDRIQIHFSLALENYPDLYSDINDIYQQAIYTWSTNYCLIASSKCVFLYDPSVNEKNLFKIASN